MVVNPAFDANVVTPTDWNPPPTLRLFSIPTPPSTVKQPESLLNESVVFVISTTLLILTTPFKTTLSLALTSLSKLTGPSNSDRIVLDLPPSTSILSLTITSSKQHLF